jgi:hypothetical protein
MHVFGATLAIVAIFISSEDPHGFLWTTAFCTPLHTKLQFMKELTPDCDKFSITFSPLRSVGATVLTY